MFFVAASKNLIALAKSLTLTLAFLASLGAGSALAPGIPNTGASSSNPGYTRTPQERTTPGAVPAADRPELRASSSLNWAGYVADTGTYTSVSGTWVVPDVSDAVDGADATWVGIGGVRSHDLIQAGTETLVDGGTLEYRAWYELLPGDSYLLPIDIHPGDTVSVSIEKLDTTDLWRITVTDQTTGDRAVRDLHYASTFSSAEWIEEMPAAVGASLSLDNFGAVRFLAGSATADGSSTPLADLDTRVIRMANIAGDTVASVTDITGSGQFTVVRTPALATPVSIDPGDDNSWWPD